MTNPDYPLRAATYNIRHGTSADDLPCLDQIAAVLAFLDADLIALQEVDMNMPRSQRQKQAALLARKLNMGYVFGEAIRFGPGSYGNAVLSRYPILGFRKHILPDPLETRCCLEVHVSVYRQAIGFFAVHLGLNHPVRVSQVRDIVLPSLKAFPGPVILAGDLNAASDQEEIVLLCEELQDCFEWNTGVLFNTFPSHRPVERIDYLLVNSLIKPAECYIADAVASDHLPVVADLLLQTQSR